MCGAAAITLKLVVITLSHREVNEAADSGPATFRAWLAKVNSR
jgi:hypothetical protein